MSRYKTLPQMTMFDADLPVMIIDTETGGIFLESAIDNADKAAYDLWVAEGNTPEPWNPE